LDVLGHEGEMPLFELLALISKFWMLLPSRGVFYRLCPELRSLLLSAVLVSESSLVVQVLTLVALPSFPMTIGYSRRVALLIWTLPEPLMVMFQGPYVIAALCCSLIARGLQKAIILALNPPEMAPALVVPQIVVDLIQFKGVVLHDNKIVLILLFRGRSIRRGMGLAKNNQRIFICVRHHL
jgi:hypothetical protein